MIDFLKRRCGAFILLAVAVYSLVYALAFVQLYFVEHPYKVASYWIFENVPAGSRLVGPHWDDKVPVSLPGNNTSVYVMEGRDNELPVYERDTPQTIELIVRRMSLSDYVVFPTPRTPDSIPRIPEEYPNTTALLRLLWGEKLGFKLVKTFKNRPSLFGITFNDDLADESFSVYDHPKVVVFQNVEKLSADEISRRIKDVNRYQPLPTMNEMLLMDEGGWQPTAKLWRSEWNILARVLGLVVLLAASTWIIVCQAFRRLPDAGLGISLSIGVVFATAAGWLLGFAGFIPLTHNGAVAVVVAIVAIALMRVSLRADVRKHVSVSIAKHGLYVLGAVVFGAVVSTVMRSSDPGFFGPGEDVDATYLSYLSRTADPVPMDIFQAGHVLPLRMADRFVFSWLLKLGAIDATLAVQAVSVVIGGILGGLLYALFTLLFRGRRVALVGTVVALIPSTYVLHVVRDSSNRAVIGSEGVELLQGASVNGELARWVRHTIKGTPCFVAACDDGASKILPAAVGLPVCERSLTSSPGAGASGQEPALCKLDEPAAAFARMMELGVELFVTPAEQVATSDSSRRRISSFTERSELFSKIFDDGRYAVFVPAFSSYFPRAKDPLSS